MKMNEEKAKLEKAKALEALKDEMIPVNVSLFKPYHDFLKDYLKFFSSKQTIEDICRSMICDTVKYLYQELSDYVQYSGHRIESDACFKKWPFLSCVAVDDEDEEHE